MEDPNGAAEKIAAAGIIPKAPLALKALPNCNIVYIDGKCYHLDVTSMIGCNPDREKPYYYCDYNETDEEIGENHYWEKSPRCATEFINESLPNQTRLRAVDSMYDLEHQLMSVNVRDGLVVIFELDMDGSKQMLANRITEVSNADITDLLDAASEESVSPLVIIVDDNRIILTGGKQV